MSDESNKVTFEYIRDVNSGREYVKVKKPAIRRWLHVPLEDFEEAAKRLAELSAQSGQV